MKVVGKKVSGLWWLLMGCTFLVGIALTSLFLLGVKEIDFTEDDVKALLSNHLPKTMPVTVLGKAAEITISEDAVVDFREGDKIFVATNGAVQFDGKGSADFGLEFIFFPELRGAAVYLPMKSLDIVSFKLSEDALENLTKAKDEGVAKVKSVVGKKVNGAIERLGKIGITFEKKGESITSEAVKKAAISAMKKTGIEINAEKFNAVTKEKVKIFAEEVVVFALNTFPVKKLNTLESIVVMGVKDIVSDYDSITIHFSFFQLGVKLIIFVIIFIGLVALAFNSPRWINGMSVGAEAIDMMVQ